MRPSIVPMDILGEGPSVVFPSEQRYYINLDR